MTKIIYKYEVPSTPFHWMTVPRGAEFLCLQMQKLKPVMWFLVDSEETETENRAVRQYMTGVPINDRNQPSSDTYIGTLQFHDGAFVVHYFMECV